MNAHPYMPLYYGDLLKQTAFWSGEERALLIILWATQWWNGPLPLDLAKLARGIDYEEQTFLTLWNRRVHTLFEETDAGYIHEELEARRRAVAQISGVRRSAGKASGKARRARAMRRPDPVPSPEQARADVLEQSDEQLAQAKERTSGAAFVRTPIQSNPIQINPDQEPQPSAVSAADRESKPPVPPSGADPPPTATAPNGNGHDRAPARKRRMPADHPTEQLRAWAEQNTPRVNFDAEIAQLRDHEFRDPHSDWDAVVRNWLRRAAKEISRRPRGNEEQLTRFERHKRRLYGEPQG